MIITVARVETVKGVAATEVQQIEVLIASSLHLYGHTRKCQVESHSLRHVIQNKQVTWSRKLHHGPLAGLVSSFGMSDMRFCHAQVRAVTAKTD